MSVALQSQPFTVKVSSAVSLSCTRWHFSSSSHSPSSSSSSASSSSTASFSGKGRATNAPPHFAPNVILAVHQWGKLGGSGALLRGVATNSLRLICRTLGSESAADLFDAVTFDLRGVGKSSGAATWRCIDEIDDVLGVAQFLVEKGGATNVYLVGSSAGACIAGSALAKAPSYVKAGAFIAYPKGWTAGVMFSTHFENLKKSERPKMFVSGDDDGFSSESQIRDFVKECAANGSSVELTMVNGGHFEIEQQNWDSFMSRKVSEFVLRVLENDLRTKRLQQQQEQEKEQSGAAAAAVAAADGGK